jgi:hypothetical protein
MPRTISTKPAYSVRWWKTHHLSPPERNAFAILKKTALFRYRGAIPKRRGRVALGDARSASEMLAEHKGTVSLVVTSPPYLNTTDYAEDQWLRLWFLGGPDKPSSGLHQDDRHRRPHPYWSFLAEAWKGSSSLLKDRAHIVIRIGGTTLSKEELFIGVLLSLKKGLPERTIRPLHEGETTNIRRRQTNSFRPGTSPDKV